MSWRLLRGGNGRVCLELLTLLLHCYHRLAQLIGERCSAERMHFTTCMGNRYVSASVNLDHIMAIGVANRSTCLIQDIKQILRGANLSLQ